MSDDVGTISLNRFKVCYFGHYNPFYARNRILMKALRLAGAAVTEINDRSGSIVRYRRLIIRAVRSRCDLLFVGVPGHTDVPYQVLLELVTS